ncbi:MAG: alpha/beta hydrolase [Solirubrobacteraceae bacterium]|nr:alpha/beta hydrolase [Solirubrobacteraceae bacterium]
MPLTPIIAAVVATLAPSTTQAVQAVQSRAATALDPVDIAMGFDNPAPCTSPCWKTGLVYQHTASALDPQAGIRPYALDVYRSSKTPKRDAPVVVLVHGGGFVEGDRTQMRTVGEALARAGFLAASISYRLVPADRNGGSGIASDADLIPAASEAAFDTIKAMRWIRKHRATLGATNDKSRYAVGGYSAGAITAMRVAIRGNDASTPPAMRWKVGAAFAISGLECGSWTKAYDCTAAYDKTDAPVLLFQGEADSIVPFGWAQQTCEAAAERGGGCKGYYYPRQDHFWLNGTVFGGAEGLNRAHPAIVPTVVTYLKKKLATS